MRQRITDLLSYLNTGVYEKETEIKMALLAAIAGESIILLGPKGIAEGMAAPRIVSAKKKAGWEAGMYLKIRSPTKCKIAFADGQYGVPQNRHLEMTT